MSSEEQNPDLISYTKLSFIGEGSFGKVFKVKENETGNIFAAKISHFRVNINSQKDMLNFSREVNIGSGFEHPAVLKFITYSTKNFHNKPKPVIITEYAPNGTLTRLIDLERRGLSGNIWNDTIKLINIYGIASGMSYLHEHHIIHRDLKPDNILMDQMLFPKISDFGFSKRLHSDKSASLESTTGFKGTPLYAAPESLLNNQQTEASDVYSFALIVYELLTAKKPFDGLNWDQLLDKLKNDERTPFDVPIEEAYKDLIERCWSTNPHERPTFSEIVKELEENEKFITQTIEQEDFLRYVDFVNESDKHFSDEKKFIIENQPRKAYKKVDIDRYIKELQQQQQYQNQSFIMRLFKPEKLYPYKEYIELNDECQYLVTQAENDPEKQFLIGTYLIEETNGFPLKIDLGVKYLEKSISGKCINSAFFLSKMLFDGILIPKDLKKAEKYLSNFLDSKDIRILSLYARTLLKRSNYKDSCKYFKICADEGDCYSMYKYAILLFCGYGVNKDVVEAKRYLNLSKNKGFKKSELYEIALLKYEKYDVFNRLPTPTQNFLIKQIIKYNKNDDDSIEPFTLKKILMKTKDIQILISNKSFESDDFRTMMDHFNEVTAELFFPFKKLASMLKIINDFNPKINICVIVNSFSKKLGPDNKINQIIIDDSIEKIEKSSFEKCYALTNVTIPSSVELIDCNAFSECSSLSNIVIPSSVIEIGNNAFNKCIKLTEITIPSSVTIIGDNIFNCCSSLTKVTILSNLMILSKHAFDGCSSLTEINIPPSVNSIEEYCFNNCSYLTKITIPHFVESIGNYAFNGCTYLNKITIPFSVKLIGNHAFDNCLSLTKIIMSSSTIKSIEDYTFNECTSLIEIIIPSFVKSIGNYSFNECLQLTKITIPSSVEIIESYAFSQCINLTKITIPSSVKSIGNHAFYDCRSISQILFESPSLIELIETSAFEQCSSLTEIAIPSSVKSIGHFSFKDCINLKKFFITQSTKKIESDAFVNCPFYKEKIILFQNEEQSPVQNAKIIHKSNINIIVIGSGAVGKTSILNNYVKNCFSDSEMVTIGIDFFYKYIEINEHEIKLRLQDTSGVEKFYNTGFHFLNYQDYAIFVFDISSDYCLDKSIQFFKEHREDIGSLPFIFLGNKCDISEKSEYIVQQLEEIINEYGVKYFEVSAKSGANIDEAFQYIATEIFNQRFP